MTRSGFERKILTLIEEQSKESLDLEIFIQKSAPNDNKSNCIQVNELDFDIDFKEDLFKKIPVDWSRVSLCFDGVIFKGKVRFADIQLKKLSFKDVTFQENVGIKNVQLEELCLRPYRIDAHIVVNIGKNERNAIIVDCDNNCYIKKIEFEDPHICNGKVYFIGINENTEGDFTNRNLENVVFQNCNFEQTYFLNSFLKETKFLNCEFPLVNNERDMFFWAKDTTLRSFILLIFTLPLSLPVGILYLVFYNVEILFSFLFKKTLIGSHYGIKDELSIKKKVDNKYEKLQDRISYTRIGFENIEAIYSDLKINFKNNGDEQKSGDFYYASRYMRTRLPIDFIDRLVLMGSYLINGFGERPLRSFFSIVFILVALGIFMSPNENYVTTYNTPDFLLENNITKENNSTYFSYKKNYFQVYRTTKVSEEKKINYGYRGEFEKKTVKIPKLKNDFVTKVYFATSHITMPFVSMTNSKAWFKGVSNVDYAINIISSLVLWLYLIGMMKAIFNRMRR